MNDELKAQLNEQLQSIEDNTLALLERIRKEIPRPVQYIGEGFMSTDGRPGLNICTSLNEIRRLLKLRNPKYDTANTP